jgi:hypothetical protein
MKEGIGLPHGSRYGKLYTINFLLEGPIGSSCHENTTESIKAEMTGYLLTHKISVRST